MTKPKQVKITAGKNQNQKNESQRSIERPYNNEPWDPTQS